MYSESCKCYAAFILRLTRSAQVEEELTHTHTQSHTLAASGSAIDCSLSAVMTKEPAAPSTDTVSVHRVVGPVLVYLLHGKCCYQATRQAV